MTELRKQIPPADYAYFGTTPCTQEEVKKEDNEPQGEKDAKASGTASNADEEKDATASGTEPANRVWSPSRYLASQGTQPEDQASQGTQPEDKAAAPRDTLRAKAQLDTQWTLHCVTEVRSPLCPDGVEEESLFITVVSSG